MNPITNQQRDTTYDTATQQQLYLYESPESGAKLKEIATKQNIVDKKAYTHFAIAIGDVILGLVPQEKLPDLLIERLEITRPEAMKVTADVLDFLAPLSQPPRPALPQTAQPAQTPSPRTSTSLADEIMATEIAIESAVQPMRTMAHDMESARQPQTAAGEATHQAASQADLLAGNKTKNADVSWNTTQS